MPMLETARKRLRLLIKLIEKVQRKPVCTDFEDQIPVAPPKPIPPVDRVLWTMVSGGRHLVAVERHHHDAPGRELVISLNGCFGGLVAISMQPSCAERASTSAANRVQWTSLFRAALLCRL